MRSVFGGIFPLFARYMFEAMGINWACTLLGCVAALFIPMPFFFFYKGKAIRSKSKFAPALDVAEELRLRDEESRGGGVGNELASGEDSGYGSSPGDAEKKIE